MHKTFALLTALALCLSLAACGEQTSPKESAGPATNQVQVDSVLPSDPAELFTDRDYDSGYDACVTVQLSDEGCTADGDGVSVDGTAVTVTKEGTYCFTGTLTNGQIRVSVGDTDKVQLVLKDASVSCEGSAALYILSGDKVFVTLAEGTENALASVGSFVQSDDNGVDAAIFSKSDLCFNGTGSLAVLCETGHGLVSKDDLKFTGGTYTVVAEKQGITGKDSIRIAGGTFNVTSGTDGLHSKNDEDTTRGYIYIIGGTFAVTAGTDGMDASTEVRIEAGTFAVKTGDGSASVTHSDSSWGGGMGGWWGGDSGSATTSTESRKGIKAGTAITISGGTFDLDTEDDSLHCGGNIVILDGSLTLATGDDGIHADGDLGISGGKITITKSYEGLEATNIAISGGEIDLVASDDGINAAGGNDGSGLAGPWGQGGFGAASDASVVISGGTLIMDAGGDGLDSNGDLTITGGTVYVNGPENSGNGALDYGGTAKITGGIVIALGASGMAENFGTESTQGAILCGLNGTAPAGTEVGLKDSKGNVIVSYTSGKTFSSVLISAPGVEQGGTYTIYVGEASMELTMESIIYGSGSGMGGGGGRPGGMGGGGRPGY